MTEKESLAERKSQLGAELVRIVRFHRRRRAFDASLHQLLIIVAAFAGFGALAAGFIWPDQAWIAGVIGAVPSLATVLTRQLHCVKAANWHDQQVVEIDRLRRRLQFEVPSSPTHEQIAAVSHELGVVDKKFADQWELLTKDDEMTETAHGSPIERSEKAGA